MELMNKEELQQVINACRQGIEQAILNGDSKTKEALEDVRNSTIKHTITRGYDIEWTSKARCLVVCNWYTTRG